MPGPYLHPGVYVEEIPSGVRPIAGASVSDTAFVDWFPRGPIDRAVRITSLGDFEREFGGLNANSEASYAVQQYYLNGGKVGWVVRVAAPDAALAERELTSGQLVPGGSGSGASGASGAGPDGPVMTVRAASPGGWGNALQVGIDYNGVAQSAGSPAAFNLVVREVRELGGKLVVLASETYRNLSADATSLRYVDSVVNRDSRLVRVEHTGGGLPGATGTDVAGDPASAIFLRLGQAGYQQGDAVQPTLPGSPAVTFTVGDDGTTPDEDAWALGTGANALLGQPQDGNDALNGGIYELERIAPFIFNLLCIPAAARLGAAGQKAVLDAAATLCEERRAFLLVDIPDDIDTIEDVVGWVSGDSAPKTNSAAVYFPRVRVPDPLKAGEFRSVGPSGTMAGTYARTDAERGVWKAPAGIEAGLRNATLPLRLTDRENGALNPLGINTLRSFPIYGNVAWGARTLEGSDAQASEWKYVPVRRTALFIEESLFQGLKWVVFEPNDEPLWSQIRLNVGSFMQGLFRQGAFAGQTPREAYLVKCDAETTTQADVNLGIVNIIVGFAPLKPAEFVIIKLQQLAGQVQV